MIDNRPDWVLTAGRAPQLPPDAMLLVLGRMKDVFGPMPFGMIREEAWEGNMFRYSHDLIAYMPLAAAPVDTLPEGQDAEERLGAEQG
jgi:hypothetical protein